MRTLVVGLTFVLVATTAQADNYAELARSTVNPDYKPFPNGTGIAAQARLDLPLDLHLFARFNETEFRPSGPVLGAYRQGEDWAILGSGYEIAQLAGFSFSAGASYQQVRLDGSHQQGFGLHGEVSVKPLNWLRFSLDLAYVDLVLQDIALTADLALLLTDDLALSIRLHDHSDWDFTSYETGLRWYF